MGGRREMGAWRSRERMWRGEPGGRGVDRMVGIGGASSK